MVAHSVSMNSTNHKLQYDYKGAAEMLSLSPAALRDLVYKGQGPVTVRIGRRARIRSVITLWRKV